MDIEIERTSRIEQRYTIEFINVEPQNEAGITRSADAQAALRQIETAPGKKKYTGDNNVIRSFLSHLLKQQSAISLEAAEPAFDRLRNLEASPIKSRAQELSSQVATGSVGRQDFKLGS